MKFEEATPGHLSDACPCGLGRAYASCCGPLHSGLRRAATAQELMRSRYSAFVKVRGDYLNLTATGQMSEFELSELMRWSSRVAWLGLRIESLGAGAASDEEGTVTFTARLVEGSHFVSMSETSRFEKRLEQWLYAGGETRQSRDKIERNALCPCGSGLKFKVCHLRGS